MRTAIIPDQFSPARPSSEADVDELVLEEMTGASGASAQPNRAAVHGQRALLGMKQHTEMLHKRRMPHRGIPGTYFACMHPHGLAPVYSLLGPVSSKSCAGGFVHWHTQI